MKKLITLTIVSLLHFSAYSQTGTPDCQSYYSHLESLTQKNVVVLGDVSSALEITKKLVNANCSIDEFPVTSTMRHLIIKSNDPNAVTYYFDYRILQAGSVEEELNYSFNRIYEKYPEKVLEIISSLSKDYQERLINVLGWEFQEDNYKDLKKTGLSSTDYYFSKYPELRKLIPTYGPIIKRIIRASEFEE